MEGLSDVITILCSLIMMNEGYQGRLFGVASSQFIMASICYQVASTSYQ